MRTKLVPKLLVSLATIVGLVALAEGGSYLWGSFAGRSSPLRTAFIQGLSQHDPVLFWRLRPDADSEDGIHTNSHGLRGPEIPPKPAGEYRILSLGESTTFAKQIEYDESYSAVLEQKLNGDGGGKPVRVVNAGVPGYTLFQGYQFLVHRSAELEPDGVLLYFGINDFLPVAYLTEHAAGELAAVSGLNDWELYELRQRPLERLREFLSAHSNLYRALSSGEVEANRRAEIAVDPEDQRVPEEHRRKLLALSREFCERHGLDLFVAIPWYREFTTHETLLRESGQETGAALIDLPRVLDPRLAKPRREYFLDNMHPTAEGHRLIAEALYEVLAQRGI